MLNFVLTVIKDNLLDACEVFENQEDALSSAEYFCRYNNIPLHENFTHDNYDKVWLVSDDYGYLVTVTCRPTHTSRYYPQGSYHTFLDTLSGRNYPLYRQSNRLSNFDFLNKDYLYDKINYPAPPALISDPITLPISKDDPKDLTLPGGFNYLNDKPMTMKEVSEDPLAVRTAPFLSDHQKWALVTARVRHRPDIYYQNKDGLFPRNQLSLLNGLKEKASFAETFVKEQIEEIQAMYIEFINRLPDVSSSTYYEDESSSSEEIDE